MGAAAPDEALEVPEPVAAAVDAAVGGVEHPEKFEMSLRLAVLEKLEVFFVKRLYCVALGVANDHAERNQVHHHA